VSVVDASFERVMFARQGREERGRR
jgi:hypothetical protein